MQQDLKSWVEITGVEANLNTTQNDVFSDPVCPKQWDSVFMFLSWYSLQTPKDLHLDIEKISLNIFTDQHSVMCLYENLSSKLLWNNKDLCSITAIKN